jgi:hypothetical protein
LRGLDTASGRQSPSAMQAPAFGPLRPPYIAVEGIDAGCDLILPLPQSPPITSPLPPPLQFLPAGHLRKPRHPQMRPACAADMSESSSIGRGGGHIGRAGSSCGGGNNDDEEVKKRRSDTARPRGSYRYTKYGLTSSPAFNKWEAQANRSRGSPASAPAASR